MDEQKKRLYELIRTVRDYSNYYYGLANKAKSKDVYNRCTKLADDYKHDESAFIRVAIVLYGQTIADTVADINKYIEDRKNGEER